MKKVKVCIVFLLKLMWFTRNDLAQGLQTFCPRTRWGSTEHVEGLTSYILWLFRGMPYSPKSTNFRKYIFSSMTKFFAGRSLEAPDLATVSYAFCCWLQISLTMSNLSFRVRRELSTGLHLQEKDQDKTMWQSATVARRVTRGDRKAPYPYQILNCTYWTIEKNCHDRVQPINHSAKL